MIRSNKRTHVSHSAFIIHYSLFSFSHSHTFTLSFSRNYHKFTSIEFFCFDNFFIFSHLKVVEALKKELEILKTEAANVENEKKKLQEQVKKFQEEAKSLKEESARFKEEADTFKLENEKLKQQLQVFLVLLWFRFVIILCF